MSIEPTTRSPSGRMSVTHTETEWTMMVGPYSLLPGVFLLPVEIFLLYVFLGPDAAHMKFWIRGVVVAAIFGTNYWVIVGSWITRELRISGDHIEIIKDQKVQRRLPIADVTGTRTGRGVFMKHKLILTRANGSDEVLADAMSQRDCDWADGVIMRACRRSSVPKA